MSQKLMAQAVLRRAKRFLTRPLTLLMVPARGSDVKSIKLPLWLAAVSGLALSALLVVAGCACFQMAQMQADQVELSRLQQVNAQQDAQLRSLQQQAQQERTSFQEITSLEQRLRAMVGLSSSGQASRFEPGGGTPEQRAMLLAGLFQPGPSATAVATDLNQTDQEAAATEQGLLVLQGQVSAHFQALAAMPDHWPVSGPITSPFGWRGNPFGDGGSEFHYGIDIGVPYGTPVEAAGAGTVCFVGYLSGYGRTITIDHGNGYQSSYCHLSATYTTVGKKVNKGDVIGAVGINGRSTGPHLHFGMTLNGAWINPRPLLK